MKKAALFLLWLWPLWLLTVSAGAQEKSAGTPANQSDNRDNRSAPPAVGQNLNGNGKNMTGKPVIVSKEAQQPLAGAPESASPDKQWREPLLVSPGKRDPFRPFTLNTRTAQNRKRENLSPLERYELGQLKLVGIIAPNAKTLSALVEDSSGLGYVVKVGTAIGINDGKVVAIRRDAVVVEEIYVDLYGAQKKREVSMKLAAETSE
jgi:Tfp pilus assembly protein PilP